MLHLNKVLLLKRREVRWLQNQFSLYMVYHSYENNTHKKMSQAIYDDIGRIVAPGKLSNLEPIIFFFDVGIVLVLNNEL